MGIVAALLLLTGIFYVYAISEWISDWKLTHAISHHVASHANSETSSLIASLPDAHLFGQAMTDLNDAPVSNLQFKVTGIVKVTSGNNKEVSKAYISLNGEPAKIYEIGDNLPYGVKVYDITTDTVMLENSGHLEKLLLPREQLVFKPSEPLGGQ